MGTNDFRVLFVYPNLMYQTMFPMGIAILSSILKQHGYKAEGFDTTFYETDEASPHEYQVKTLQYKPPSEEFEQALRQAARPLGAMLPDFRSKIESFQPDLIAVSAVEDTFRLAVDLLEGIRDFKIPNIVGGVFPTFAPEKAIKEEVVDIICVGEGEGPLLDLCQALSRGQDHAKIANLWVKKTNGDIVRNPLRTAVDLDKLPIPDFSLFDSKRFYFTTKAQGKLIRSGSVETARGCPYTCSFCNSPGQVKLYDLSGAGEFFRLKSVENVYQELRNLRDDFQVEYIHFPADTFLAMPDSYLNQFAEMYREIDLPFWCQTRSETLTKERVEILEKLRCQNVSIGLEHGNERFRSEVVNRNYSNQEFVDKLSLLEGTSINVTINNIVGLPTETRELTWDSIRLNREVSHLTNNVNAFHFVPYHGTPLRRVALQEGYIDNETRLEHNFKDTVMNMPQYSGDQIRGVVRAFNLYVRFPETEFPRIAIAERLDDEGNRMFEQLQREFLDRCYTGDAILGRSISRPAPRNGN